jgi:YVTN family beta-propeller protein
MTGAGNLLFVTLSTEDRVAVINTETLTVVDQITVTGSCPHTAILAGDSWLSSAP